MNRSKTGGTRSGAGREELSRTPRCSHTLLTKPECHCTACLYEQIATYGRIAGGAARPVGRAA